MNMEYTYNYRPDFFEDETVARAAARLNALKAAGVDTIIDLTVLGLGRHIPSLAKVAAQTDLNIAIAFRDENNRTLPTRCRVASMRD